MTSSFEPHSEHSAIPNEPAEECPLCHGFGWRREWLLPILLALASVLLFILGGWGLVYYTRMETRSRRYVATWAILGLYVSILPPGRRAGACVAVPAAGAGF